MTFSTYLITHKKSKYNPSKLIDSFSKAMAKFSSNQFEVIGTDKYKIDQVKITDLFTSEIYLPILMEKWNLRGRVNCFSVSRSFVVLTVRFLVGFSTLVLALLSRDKRQSLVLKNLRILNISNSHLDAWNRGLLSGANFVCVLEDDGLVEDIAGLEQVLEWINSHLKDIDLVLVDISNSFSFLELAVNPHHLKTISQILGEGQQVVETLTPVTNTCAAVVYTHEMLHELSKFLESSMKSNLYRSIPIDWQINRFLMGSASFSNPRTLHVTPGLVFQLSIIRDLP